MSLTGQLTATDKQIKVGRPLVIGIVAGEASGDALGADFMRQMNNLCDEIVWVGVGGSKMQAEGLQPLFDMQRLSVMGLFEVLTHLPDLLAARRELLDAFSKAQLDWFVGIDAPDFNLRVSKQLKPSGVFCVQYVSPSVWAWRESRIHTIKAATHLVLCLFPFELEVYERHQHWAVCVGHPLLNNIDKVLLTTPMLQQRRDLVWHHDGLQEFFIQRFQDVSQLICIMPGSRRSEINAILPLLFDAMNRILLVDDKLCFIIPTVDKNHQYIVQDLLEQQPLALQKATVVVFDETQKNFSQKAMAASDMVILASGTATFEAMLLNRPMVVVYQLKWLTYQIAKRLVKIPFVALPNILAGQQIVPELIQENATKENICRCVSQLQNERDYRIQQAHLAEVTTMLRKQSNHQAIHAVISHWWQWQRHL